VTTRKENHGYALAIIEAKNAEIRDLHVANRRLSDMLVIAEGQRDMLRAERDALHAKVAALIAHMNQVHEELGGTDTVLTLQAAQYVVAERDALRTVATGWCAECKGMGLITVHTKDSANSGNVTTRRCVCGGEPLFTTRGGAAVSDPTTVPFSFYAKLTQDYERSLRAEIHELRTVYQAAAVYCGDRTVANEHALIDAVGDAKALAVQP
jgi:hypothetical protein